MNIDEGPLHEMMVDSDYHPDLMLPEEVADYMRVKPSTVKAWLRKKDPKVFKDAFKIGNAWRIPRANVLEVTKSLYGDDEGVRLPVADSRVKRWK